MKNHQLKFRRRYLKVYFKNVVEKISLLFKIQLKNYFSRNKKKFLAFLLLILLISINFKVLPKIESYHIWNLLNAITEHFISALVIFILFSNELKKFLTSHKFREENAFVAEKFFLRVSNSKHKIKILETYIETLMANKDAFLKSLNSFVGSFEGRKAIASIKILLISPQAEFVKTRIKDLEKHNRKKENYEPCETYTEYEIKFINDMQKWLEEIKEIKDSVNSFAKVKKVSIDFDIRIYDAITPYSMYSSDDYASFGFYRGNVPSTDSVQLVVDDLETDAGKFLIYRFDEIWNSEHTNKRTRKLEEYLESPNDISTLPAVSKFIKIRTSKNVDEIADLLREITPEKLSKAELFGLIDYLKETLTPAEKLIPTNNFNKHYNSFGTGGDKTINLSTMASILASHFNPEVIVTKIGTVAVTSEVGSVDFHHALNRYVSTHEKELIKEGINIEYLKFNSQNDSSYIPVGSFGFEYSELIRDGRRAIYPQTLDIFKLLFPFYNYGHFAGQVNGVSNAQYIRFYETLYKQYKTNAIIVHNSTSRRDELYAGNNTIQIYKNGERIYTNDDEFEIKCDMQIKEYDKYFCESETLKHVEKFVKLFRKESHGGVHRCIKMTVAYNIAVILKLNYPNEGIEVLAKKAYAKFFKNTEN